MIGWLGVFALGCSGAPPADTDTDTEPPGCRADWSDALGDAPDFSVDPGWFELTHDASSGRFDGGITEPPADAGWIETARAGSCRRLERATCAPSCAEGDVCVDGSCATPVRRSAGELFLHTSAGPMRVLESDGRYALDTGPAAGLVVLAAEGADVPAFELRACAHPPIAIDAPTRAPGDDLTLTWPPVERARARLRIDAGDVRIACEGPDGALSVPGGWLDALVDPTAVLARTTTSKVELDEGVVALVVGAEAAFGYVTTPPESP